MIVQWPVSLWFGYHFIISLVTGKNKYEINAFMKKGSYDNI